ncbi:MAG: hypothetical protein GQ531_06715 [Sulfurovum sp.]|nr:hypothetical protein [Sulfurovum sp.]
MKKVNNQGEYRAGDLATISYHLDLMLLRKNIKNLEKKHISTVESNSTKVDMIVVGDSFSNGGGMGENNYYQDYIATYNDFTVLNILQLPDTNDFIETIVLLANSGYLKKHKVKHVLLETVQREALVRFAKDISYDIHSKEDILDKEIASVANLYIDDVSTHRKIQVINNLNNNAFLYNLKFMLKGYGSNKNYYIEKINQDLFTSKVPNEIIFIKHDIDRIIHENDENIQQMNDNFNKLADFLAKQNIELSVMVCVDKYTLYRKYISSHTYQKSVFFEKLKTLPKRYQFIDTKEILVKELDKGVLDLYYPDDTHWSYKASEAIFKTIKFDKD